MSAPDSDPGSLRSGTLLGVATFAASGLESNVGTALLLLENEQLTMAAEHGLSEADHQVVALLSREASVRQLSEFEERHGVRIKPLLTATAELLGALVVFGLDSQRKEVALERKLNEICSIATLAIEQKHLLEELTYRAHHDPLTQLWNRTWLEEQTARVLSESAGRFVWTGLAIFGLDRFRVINDVLGYEVGNELLRQVARRVREAIDPAVSLARSGGDEFVLLMPELISRRQVAAYASTVLGCFEEPYRIGDNELIVKANIGTAICDGGDIDAIELYSRAFTALRFAKSRCRGQVAEFDHSMLRIPPERLALEQHLRFALQKREFELYYQPQIDLRAGRLVGVEALLRWNHPSLGFISPAIFVPVLEEIGIIEEVGDWVISEAIRQLQEWQNELPALRMAVNVSGLQFSRKNFSSYIAQQLRRSGISPRQLELEITESAVMADFEHGLRQIKMLCSLGVTLALDDFGTGHSSLAYLQQLPVHRLKIDRMFVREITQREERPPLLVSIVSMAQGLNLSVIVEGVETDEQLACVAALGCGEVQGFLFSKPLTARQLLNWARDGHAGVRALTDECRRERVA